MEFFNNITGKNALEKMDHTAAEMEQVYAAFATRMIEILDKEERLDIAQKQLDERLSRFSVDRWSADLQSCRASHEQLEKRIANTEREKSRLGGEVRKLQRKVVLAVGTASVAILLGLGAGLVAVLG
jgi:biotin-(acetyl-CoA carboxylase) ligase